MKQLALFFLLVGFSARGGAQPLQAHAGVDTAVCPLQGTGSSTQPRIGGPTTGGIAPYTYSWTSDFTSAGIASLLDSPNRATPRVIVQPMAGLDSVSFIVAVTDAAGAVSRDTVLVRLSRWMYITVTCMRPQSGADTVHFNTSTTTAGSNFGPFTHIRWTPSPYLSDTTIEDPKCWAPPGMFFTKYGTDRAGCRGSIGGCGTYFWPNSIADAENTRNVFRIVPSPTAVDSRIEISPDLLGTELRIFSADGRAVRTLTLQSLSTRLMSITALPPGQYFYRIAKAGSPPLTGRFTMQD